MDVCTPVTAAYVHIPFCRRRCYYCDFPVSVVGDRRNGSNSGTIQQYLQVLQQEIQLTAHWLGTDTPLRTVFFGGGTPSLLTAAQIAQVLQTLDQQWGIAADAEISMEIDPGTFDLAQVQGYRAAGVNRISLGVQAFQANLLAACGRTHTVADITQAVEWLHQAEIRNFSLDLISGLPHQTLEQWQESLQSAIALAPTHLSCYDLIVEPQTPFARRYQPGATPLPTDDTTAQMYRLAQHHLTAAGYRHYEISNYARPGYECRHNRVYWENRPFYGFGMGAASCLRGERFSRPRTLRGYGAWVEELRGAIAHGHTPPGFSTEATAMSALDRLQDTLMLGLRLAEGLDLHAVAEEFGEGAIAALLTGLDPYVRQGWVVYDEPTDAARLPCHCRLTDPEGFLFSNTVLTTLFHHLTPDTPPDTPEAAIHL